MKSIVIVGAGALGSHLVLLARNWKVNICVVDFDRIESKNIQSQFHTNMGQGKNKAKALQQMMQGMFKLRISAFSSKLVRNNQITLLCEKDLIIDCTDNFEARNTIQEFARDFEVDCVHGCLSADGSLGRVVWTEHFKPDKEGTEGEATCEDGQNLPFHALVSAVIAQVVQEYLENGEKKSWQVMPFSMIRLM